MIKNKPLYLDYASTTPMDPKVLDSMIPFFTSEFGNASSSDHIYGERAKKAVDLAREQISQLINAQTGEIIFTSGATEAINLAISGIYIQSRKKGKHIITVGTEHKAVLESVKQLENKGAEISFLRINKNGLIKPEELKETLRPETILVSVMLINNETGVINDLDTISEICNAAEVPLLIDATQAIGKIPIDVKASAFKLMAFSSHKLYGPKGIGCLYIKNYNLIRSMIWGGDQEKGYRAGTLNTSGIAGFGMACEIAKLRLKDDHIKIETLMNNLLSALSKVHPIAVNGSTLNKSPYISNIQFPGQNALELILKLRNKISISTGSACNSALVQPSHVLLAMGLTQAEANNSIRISLGNPITEEDIDYTAQCFSHLLA